jgi:membrane protein required for colicin V production
MNALDIVIGVIGGFCLIRGVFRGIVKEIASIAGVLVGFYAAYTYYGPVARWLSPLIKNESYRSIAGFCLTFTLLFLAVGFLGVVLRHMLKAAALGGLDRVFGALFGLVKALLIASVLLVALTTFLSKDAPVMKNSVLAPYVSVVSQKMALLVPKDMKEKFHDNLSGLRKAWSEL